MADEEDLSDLSVAIMMIARHALDTTVPTLTSIAATLTILHNHGIKHEFFCRTGSDLRGARNGMLKKYLETEYSRCFLVDSDMGWRAEDFARVLLLSRRYEVIGAAYRSKEEKEHFSCDFDMREAKQDAFGCIPIIGMGLGFTCIQRKVLEQLSEQAPKATHMHFKEPYAEVFRFDKRGNEQRGEDFAFFADVRDLGYVPHIDPTISLRHIGAGEYSGSFLDAVKRSNERQAAAVAAE